jgi:hypothetical protein
MERLIKENETLEEIISEQGERIIELTNYVEMLKETIFQQGITIGNFRNYKERLSQEIIERNEENQMEMVEETNNELESQQRRSNKRKRQEEQNETNEKKKLRKDGKIENLIKTLKKNKQNMEVIEPEDLGETLSRTYKEVVNEEIKLEQQKVETMRIYYKFGRKIEERFNYYRRTDGERQADKWVNKEIRQGFVGEIKNEDLRKRKERARKIYCLFSKIGYGKIENMQEFSIWDIERLSWDRIDYIIERIIENE